MTNLEAWNKHFAEALEIGIDEFEMKSELASIPTWDSMAALQIIAMADVEYELELTGDQLKSCKTIQDLFALFG